MSHTADDEPPVISQTGIDSRTISGLVLRWHQDRLVYSGMQTVDEQHSKVVGLLELNGAGDWIKLLGTGNDEGYGLLEFHLDGNRVDAVLPFRQSAATSQSLTRLVSFDLPLHANGFD